MYSFNFYKSGVLIIVIFCIFSFAGLQGFGQLSEIQNSYAKYNRHNLQEKIYVHTDRSFYLCNEILWFKVYIMNAADNQPMPLSKVVYIEVLNKQQTVLQAKIAMKNGSGSGSFFLPLSIASGNYQLRAYTSWMKNFSPGHYFEKNISIVNTSRNLDSSAIHESAGYEAGFFPEGGNLVMGLESEVAFKVNDNKNKGIDCKGVIVDQLNDTVTHFKTLQSGMGHFYLNPAEGKDYTAVINFNDGSVIRKALPKAYTKGYVMHVADTGTNDLKISVRSKGLIENISPDIYVIIQNSRHIILARSQRFENNVAALVINKDSLKEGVNGITIFDANKQPLCERLYFKRPENKMLVSAKANKNNYQLRDKVVIDISTANQLEKLLPGNLSASVYRLDSLHQPDHENIFSYLWLSSELKGDIENPEYYFKNENAKVNEALDNLMLTQGWRKFDWEKVLQNKIPAFAYVPEYSGHIITGKITNKATKTPASGVLVYLSVSGRRVQLKGCISDSMGMVHFDMKDFYGPSQIVMQTNTRDNSIFQLEIFNPFSENFSGDSIPSFFVSESSAEYLQSRNLHVHVENAYHEKDLQKLKTLQIDTLPFYNKPFKTYLLDNYTRFTTMEEVMREYVDEINVRRSGKQYKFLTVNAPGFALSDKQPALKVFEDNPLILLDGVPVFDVNKIISYDPLKVQKLEIVASKYHWGPISADGIASYTTYKGTLEGYTLDPNDLVVDYEGLQRQRVFYSPDYSSAKEFQSRLSDFRNVLYWSPNVSTNENGKGQISFFTGDVPGKYLVVLQGISPNGDAGSTTLILNAEK